MTGSPAGAAPQLDPAAVRHPNVGDAFIDRLRLALGRSDQMTANPAVRAHYEAGFAGPAPGPADVVVFAETTADVSRVLAVCDAARVPVVAYGAGTSVEGHVVSALGGVCLDLGRMNAVLAVDPDNLTATVQPGVVRTQLNAAAGEHGLAFPVDPGADATIGGMIATNASGTTTVRYGSMRQQVLRLEVVLADGRVVHTGSLARKSSAGYDLTSLMVGSEGTLGVITEAVLRLHGIPERTVVLRAQFHDVHAAARCAARCMALGLAVSRLELMDAATVAMLNEYAERDDPVAPCLLIEAEGVGAAVDDDIAVASEVAEGEGAIACETIADPTARARLWRARHAAAHAFAARSRGRAVRATDVCVPIAELPGAIGLAQSLLERDALEGLVAGHAGDGNYHVVFYYDAEDAGETARADALVEALVEHALDVGGTCTGEHGIGVGKKQHLISEHGDLIPLMRSIKADFDPRGILNPTKIFDLVP